MGSLNNTRHEKFCLEVIAGRSRKDAVINAGYSEHSARMYPFILLRRPDIQARIKELQEAAASDKVMDLMRRKEHLSEIAGARITDFMAAKDSPQIYVDRDTPGTAAIQSIQVREAKGGAAPGRVTDIKLHDPVRAIAELNKMEGVYPPEKHQIAGDKGPVEIVVKYADPERKKPSSEASKI